MDRIDFEKINFWGKLREKIISMKFFVFLFMILLVCIPVVTFDLTFVSKYEKNILNQKKDEVLKESQKLSLKITDWVNEKKFYLDDYKKNILFDGNVLLKLSSTIFDSVMVLDNKYKVVTDNTYVSTGTTVISNDLTKAYLGEDRVYVNNENKTIYAFIPIVSKEKNDVVDGVLVTNYPIDTTLKNIDIVRSSIRTIELVILVICFLIVYIFSVIITRPYKRILNQIYELTNNLSSRMDVGTFFETREISQAFNKLMQKQLMEDELKQEFVSNVSHELRTPITSIKVLADSLLAQENVPNEMYKEFMIDIRNEIDRENKIITDLLSIVKLENKEIKLNFEICCVSDMVDNIIKRLKPIADKKNVELIYDRLAEVNVKIDELKLSLAFTNLIENAIKYNREGGWVRIYLNADYNYLYFKVSDNGFGIPEDEQENIFQRFYRVDKSRSKETGGTGLGLSITRSIIIKHRGIIRVSSDGESGSIFTVRIPINED